jgi:hypothetical protein
MGHEILSVLNATWTNFLALLMRFLPRLLAMTAIVVVGWLIAHVTRVVVRRALRLVRVSSLFERSGAMDLLRRAEVPPPERILGAVAFWLVWIAFLLSGMHALGFAGTDLLVADLVRFVPKLVAATVVGLAGVAVSNFFWRATLLAAVNARIPSARLLGGLVRGLGLVATLAMALEQIEVAWGVVRTAFTLTFGAVMLAAAIAFGLGGRSLAQRFLEETLARKNASPEEPPHV